MNGFENGRFWKMTYYSILRRGWLPRFIHGLWYQQKSISKMFDFDKKIIIKKSLIELN